MRNPLEMFWLFLSDPDDTTTVSVRMDQVREVYTVPPSSPKTVPAGMAHPGKPGASLGVSGGAEGFTVVVTPQGKYRVADSPTSIFERIHRVTNFRENNP